jgi:hypothetical protein
VICADTNNYLVEGGFSRSLAFLSVRKSSSEQDEARHG